MQHYAPIPIDVKHARVKEIFDSETVSNENSFLLRCLTAMYDSNCLKGDYHGRFSSSASTFDGGSVNDVRIYFNKTLIRSQNDAIGSTRVDQLRGLMRTRSAKPKMLVVFGDFMIGNGSWPSTPFIEFREGKFSPLNTSILIEKDGIVLGALVVVSNASNTYRLHVINTPFISNQAGKSTTTMDAQALTELVDVFEIASSIVNTQVNDNDSRRFNVLDAMKYCSTWAASLYGITSDFDINSISRHQTAQRLRAAENDRNHVISRLANVSRNLALVKLELDKLEVNPDNMLDVNSISHPLIDFAYVEAKMDEQSYPVIRIYTKVVSMFPDAHTDRYPEYDPEIGVPCGKFVIKIDFNDSEVIRFKSETYESGVRGYERHMQHPHVFGGHNACWGNFGETLSDLIAKFDIVGLVDLALLFLQQANNGDSAGQHWPTWTQTPEYPKLVEEYLAQQEAA